MNEFLFVLKDKGSLVKQYALVDVKKYSIVATGTTQKDTLNTYRKLLKENGISAKTSSESIEKQYAHQQVTVKNIRFANIGEDTYVYITDQNGNVYKEKFADDETLIFIQENDVIDIYYEETQETKIRTIEEWKSKNEETTTEKNK